MENLSQKSKARSQVGMAVEHYYWSVLLSSKVFSPRGEAHTVEHTYLARHCAHIHDRIGVLDLDGRLSVVSGRKIMIALPSFGGKGGKMNERKCMEGILVCFSFTLIPGGVFVA